MGFSFFAPVGRDRDVLERGPVRVPPAPSLYIRQYDAI
jgi:hypothetical protein